MCAASCLAQKNLESDVSKKIFTATPPKCEDNQPNQEAFTKNLRNCFDSGTSLAGRARRFSGGS